MQSIRDVEIAGLLLCILQAVKTVFALNFTLCKTITVYNS